MLRPPHWLAAALGILLSANAHAQTTPVPIFGITKTWKYQQTTNFDGVNWMAPAYDDSSWPSGPALLYVENNAAVMPRNTPLILGPITYYFRAHFEFTNGASGASLVFSNLIDDGAVFHLNGTEVRRVRMPAAPAPISSSTLASDSPPISNDATTYDVFTLTGDALTNLHYGDNVLAVEVHQQTPTSTDIVWGSAVSALVYTGPLTFTIQPTNNSVLDGRPVTITARAVAEPDPTYQWFKDGVAIQGATNRTYSLTATYPFHAGTYFLQASNASGTLTSSNSILTVVDDFDNPVALSATGAKDLVTIVIEFDEPPDAVSAQNTNSFAVLPGDPSSTQVQVLSAEITNQTHVVLVTTPRTARSNYRVHLNGVHDLSSRSNTLTAELPLRSVVDLVTIDATTFWRFNDSGLETAAGWTDPGFDDSAWSNGAAVFYAGTQAGQLPELARTTLALTNRSDTNRVLTYYFRLRWDFPGEPVSASLRLRYLVDDGAVFYLNGAEVHSIRMPTNRPPASTDLAAPAIGVAIYEPATNLHGVPLSVSNLSAGQNILAVEVHQGTTTSSDIALAATLEATIEQFTTPARVQFASTMTNTVALAHEPVALQWQLTNSGPVVTAVTVSNRVPAEAAYAGGSAGIGSLLLTNGHVLWAVTNLTSNGTGTATVRFLFTNSIDLLITNHSVALLGLPAASGSDNSVTLIFPVLADNDHNNLGDTWELGNFGGPGVAPGADADDDGFSNGQEFLSGTDPHDASNVLRVTRITTDSNTVAITFFAARGKSYAIERGTSVTGPWSDIRVVPGESAPVTVTESTIAGPVFYRVRRQP